MKPVELIALRFLISGRVQGVGFRWFTRNVAEQIGISGTVRNMPDGRVEAVGVGTADQLRAFRARIEEGPSYSHVTGIAEEQFEEVPRHSRFDIIL